LVGNKTKLIKERKVNKENREKFIKIIIFFETDSIIEENNLSLVEFIIKDENFI